MYLKKKGKLTAAHDDDGAQHTKTLLDQTQYTQPALFALEWSLAELWHGYAGLAAAMAFATEFQGNGTPHGHGFVALCNMYQNGSLQDIADFIAKQASSLSSEEAVQRITSFIEHLHREDYYDNEKHEAAEPELEKQFNNNNDGPKENIFLSARSQGFYESPSTTGLWDCLSAENKESREALVTAEA